MTFSVVAFWASVAVLGYAYIGYPILLTLIGFLRRRPSPPVGYMPTVSVIIAAYNEATSIKRKIRDTLATNYPAERLEIVVVSDGSTDGTDAIALASGDARIQLLRVPTRRGKTHAQNEAVKRCNGDVLVFSDATAIYDPDAVRRLAVHYADPTVGAVSGRYIYFDDGASPTELGSTAFWNYENLIKYFQSRISTLTGCSGCIYSVRRSLYVPLPENACSDLVEPLHIIAAGHRVIFEHRAVAYEKTTRSVAAEFMMRVRVATHGLSGVISGAGVVGLVRHPWIGFQLISHKLLRWTTPFCLLGTLFGSAALVADSFYRWIFFAQLLFYGLGLAALFLPLHRYWRPLGLPLYFCTLNAATLISIVQVLRGQRYVIWNTVRQ
jgi:cellulose synthase/poly-beta-1,6-N-acetylglucosamine synthase-like glycosyltransferase